MLDFENKFVKSVTEMYGVVYKLCSTSSKSDNHDYTVIINNNTFFVSLRSGGFSELSEERKSMYYHLAMQGFCVFSVSTVEEIQEFLRLTVKITRWRDGVQPPHIFEDYSFFNGGGFYVFEGATVAMENLGR